MRKIMFYFLISFLTARALSPDHSKASQNDNWDKDRMEALVQYGETLLKHGRDTYKNIPLFSDYLEVSTLKLPKNVIHRSKDQDQDQNNLSTGVSSNLAYQKPHAFSRWSK